MAKLKKEKILSGGQANIATGNHILQAYTEVSGKPVGSVYQSWLPSVPAIPVLSMYPAEARVCIHQNMARDGSSVHNSPKVLNRQMRPRDSHTMECHLQVHAAPWANFDRLKVRNKCNQFRITPFI